MRTESYQKQKILVLSLVIHLKQMADLTKLSLRKPQCYIEEKITRHRALGRYQSKT